MTTATAIPEIEAFADALLKQGIDPSVVSKARGLVTFKNGKPPGAEILEQFSNRIVAGISAVPKHAVDHFLGNALGESITSGKNLVAGMVHDLKVIETGIIEARAKNRDIDQLFHKEIVKGEIPPHLSPVQNTTSSSLHMSEEALEKRAFAKNIITSIGVILGLNVCVTKLYDTFAGSKDIDPNTGVMTRNWTATLKNLGIATLGAGGAWASLWFGNRTTHGR